MRRRAAGGSQVVVTTSNTGHHPYLGLDWFILDLLASSTVFIIFEKLFRCMTASPCSARNGRWT